MLLSWQPRSFLAVFLMLIMGLTMSCEHQNMKKEMVSEQVVVAEVEPVQSDKAGQVESDVKTEPVVNIEKEERSMQMTKEPQTVGETEEKAANKVKLETTKGDIIIELDGKAAPVTVHNFLQYVNEESYDGAIFHRVIKDFMIQGGGYGADMVRKKTRKPIINEASNGLKNLRGTVAMARTQSPDSATSQFFINHKDNHFLDYVKDRNPGYAVFGKVVDGMDVVDSIAAVKTTVRNGMRDVPLEPIVIESAKVISDK